MVKKNTKENDMKRKTKGIMTAAIALVIIGSALLPREKVESIELSIPNYKPVYDINTDIPIDISVLPENAGTGSLEYISDDDSITFSSTGISTGNKEGSYTVYVVSGDIKSDTITINVADITAREELAKAEAEREAAEKAAREAEEKASREAEEKASREAEEKASKAAASNASTDQTQKSSDNQGENTNGQENAAPADANPPDGSKNNFDTYDNAEQQNTEAAYVLNTSSKKIHHPSCRSVPKIAPENYSTSNQSVDELVNQGYSTCGICFK